MSTAGAEYVALDMTIQQLNVIRRMLTDTKINPVRKLVLCTDNQEACVIVLKPRRTKSRKFIDLRHQYIQYMIQENRIGIEHVPASG